MSKTSFFFLIFFLGVIFLPIAQAAETPWQDKDELHVRLVSKDRADKTLNMAVEIRLAEGWHTYGEKPGDAGLPPRFDWTGSENFEKADVTWPKPQRFDEGGLTVYGYEKEVIFPLVAGLTDPAKPVHVNLKFDTMVCKDICIPYTFNFSLDVPSS